MHETMWKPQTIGEAPPTRDSITERGQKSFRSSEKSRLIDQLSNSLAGSLQKERGCGLIAIARTRSPLQTHRATKEATDGIAIERGAGDGIWNRHLDDTTGEKNNQTGVWGNLSRQPFVAVFDRVGMELAEAGVPGKGKKRKSNRALEAVPVAAYKKKTKNSVRIFSLLMKPVACLSRQSAILGRCEERPLSCDIVIAGIEFRLYRRSVSARKENILAFIGDFTGKILPALRLFLFSNIFHGIFKAISLLYGMVVQPIGVGKLKSFYLLTREYERSDFQATLRNSTRMNLSGHISNAMQVMPRQIIFPSWGVCWLNLCIESKILRNYCGHAFMRQICHGERHSVSIAYA